MSRTFFNFLSVEIPSRAVRTDQHAEGPSVAAVACFDSIRPAVRSLEAHRGVGVNLPRTIESVELVTSEDRGGDSVDVDREVHFVCHGHTMGQESSFVQNFSHFSSTFFRPGHPHLGTLPAALATPMPTPPFFKKFCP